MMDGISQRTDRLVFAPEERRAAVIELMRSAQRELVLSMFRCDDMSIVDVEIDVSHFHPEDGIGSIVRCVIRGSDANCRRTWRFRFGPHECERNKSCDDHEAHCNRRPHDSSPDPP